jgi:hypothetical protein
MAYATCCTRRGHDREILAQDGKRLVMAYAKTSLRKEKRDLREQMRAKGHDYREIAAELARVYTLRPCRLAGSIWVKPGRCRREIQCLLRGDGP